MQQQQHTTYDATEAVNSKDTLLLLAVVWTRSAAAT